MVVVDHRARRGNKGKIWNMERIYSLKKIILIGGDSQRDIYISVLFL